MARAIGSFAWRQFRVFCKTWLIGLRRLSRDNTATSNGVSIDDADNRTGKWFSPFPSFFYKTGCFEVSVVVRMQDCVYADIILC